MFVQIKVEDQVFGIMICKSTVDLTQNQNSRDKILT